MRTLARALALGLAGLLWLPMVPGPASAAPDPAFRYGTQLHVLWSGNTSVDVDRQLDLLAAAGAVSARVDVAWSSLQDSGPTTFAPWYVDRLDYLVAAASKRGIGLTALLTETPCWASTAPASLKQDCAGAYWERGVTKYAPAEPAAFAVAARFVAQRYAGRLDALELWNEPNYRDASYSPFVSADPARDYTALVKAAYPAVKAVAPALPVLAGALSFADTDFLTALYDHGMRGSYDAISVHPYNEGRAPGAPHDPAYAKYDLAQGLAAVHATMLAHGDSSPVWVTELGWTTCAAGADPWCVSEAQQAEYVVNAVNLVAALPWVHAVYVYGLQDKGSDPGSTEDNFGLVTVDYRSKPALAALGRAFHGVAQVRGGAGPARSVRSWRAGSRSVAIRLP